MIANPPLRTVFFAAAALLVFAAAPAAAQFDVTNTFSANTPALAAEVNQNFDEVEDELDSKLDDAANSVDAGNLAANSVGSSEIQANAVGSSEIEANAVGSSEIAANSVGTSELQDDAVTAPKIADGVITDSHISPSAAIAVSKIAGDAGFEAGFMTDNGAVPTAITSLGSIEVDAPGDGTVLLFLSGSAVLDESVTLTYGVGTAADTYLRSGSVGIFVNNAMTVLSSSHSLNVIHALSVSEGAQTFHALANSTTPLGGSASTNDVTLIAVFIPKQY